MKSKKLIITAFWGFSAFSMNMCAQHIMDTMQERPYLADKVETTQPEAKTDPSPPRPKIIPFIPWDLIVAKRLRDLSGLNVDKMSIKERTDHAENLKPLLACLSPEKSPELIKALSIKIQELLAIKPPQAVQTADVPPIQNTIQNAS